MSNNILFFGGEQWARVLEPPMLPQPQPEPVTGTRIKEGETMCAAIHDDLDYALHKEIGMVGARTLTDKIKGNITNELRTLFPWEGDKVGKGKLRYWPERLPYDWPEYFFSEMTEEQHENVNGSGFGWRDSKATPDELNIFNMLVCGGTCFRKVATWREYTLIKLQNTWNPPKWSTYYNAPDEWVKQGVCGHKKQTKVSFYGSINQGQGDLFIPLACPGGVAAIKTSEVREYPTPPFNTMVDDLPMTITELCFRGSEILGFADDGNWYFMLEQVTTNGNQGDFVVHSPDFGKTLPVPVVGWKKGQ